MNYPVIRVQHGHDKRLRAGSPWLYSNEVEAEGEAKDLVPGSVVALSDGRHVLGVGFYNPQALICFRLLSRSNKTTIDRRFFLRRLERALSMRTRLFEKPYYRMVHAEGDGLPGLVIDRYGDTVVAQLNIAGIEAMRDECLAALDATLKPATIILRNDSSARSLEGLGQHTDIAKGSLKGPITVEENGLRFVANCMAGQKTGWYFDQRRNRAFAAGLAKDQEVLDLFAHSGGFGLTALAAGATSVLAVDRSSQALDLARQGHLLQDTGDFNVLEGKLPEAAERLAAEKRRFGLVIADPPAFVPSKKDLAKGLRAYRKLASTAAMLVMEGGYLAIACCSHNVGRDVFLKETYAGIRSAGRGAWLIHEAGAGPDHPLHPALPETGYLKFLVYALD